MRLTLSDGGEWSALLCVKPYLLECYQLAVGAADALVDRGVGTLPQSLQLLVGLTTTKRGAKLRRGREGEGEGGGGGGRGRTYTCCNGF